MLELVCGFGRNAATGEERTLRHAPVQFLVPPTPAPRPHPASSPGPAPAGNGGRWAPPGEGSAAAGGAELPVMAASRLPPGALSLKQVGAGGSGLRVRELRGRAFPPRAAAAVLTGPARLGRRAARPAGCPGGWAGGRPCHAAFRADSRPRAARRFLHRKRECLGAGSEAMLLLSEETWGTWRSFQRPPEQRHPLRERRSAECPLTAGWLPSLLPSS